MPQQQQPPTTFRIEDLKARLKLEPKSRLFYPLAEELRKLNRHADAEKVLRDGLKVHASYISAWVSLGRVLIEQKKYQDAVETLQKASTLDPGNVVAARLLADAYMGLGDHVEAIKKYKLVRALLPADEEVHEKIAQLEVLLARAKIQPEAETPVSPETSLAATPAEVPADEPLGPSEARTDTEPFQAAEPPVPLTTSMSGEGPVQAVDVDAAISGARFTSAASEYAEEVIAPRKEVVGEEVVAAEEKEEVPSAMGAPPSEEPFGPSHWAAPKSDVFDETHPLRRSDLASLDPFATTTMADLYAKQGHRDEAREIYNKVLEREPANEAVKEKLVSLQPESPSPKNREVVDKLQTWLAKVARK